MKPTNSPTQANPTRERVHMSKAAWATFCHSNELFVGLDRFYIGNRLHENLPNQILRKHPNYPPGWFLTSKIR